MSADDRRQALPRGLFVVGTDTGVGKTYVTSQIARHCQARGIRVGVYKPVASGCDPLQPERSDAWQLWDAAGRPQTLAEVCPQSFAAPLAPHLAAKAVGQRVDGQRLLDGLQAWHGYELILIEGVGGLMSPLTDEMYVADLAWEWNLPLVVVAPNRLGVVNQALQTLITAATFRDGLPIAGLILSDVAPEQGDASRDTNPHELAQRCVPPLLAHTHWNDPRPLHEVDWLQLAQPVVEGHRR